MTKILNPSLLYSAGFLVFGVLDYVGGNWLGIKVDLGIALIFLGVGLSRMQNDDREI